MTELFSDRQGYRPAAAQITVREDAPSELRGAVPLIAKAAGMKPSAMREVICEVLLVRPDPDNWSEYPNVWNEVAWLMEEAWWYKVYDIAEALYEGSAHIRVEIQHKGGPTLCVRDRSSQTLDAANGSPYRYWDEARAKRGFVVVRIWRWSMMGELQTLFALSDYSGADSR